MSAARIAEQSCVTHAQDLARLEYTDRLNEARETAYTWKGPAPFLSVRRREAITNITGDDHGDHKRTH